MRKSEKKIGPGFEPGSLTDAYLQSKGFRIKYKRITIMLSFL